LLEKHSEQVVTALQRQVANPRAEQVKQTFSPGPPPQNEGIELETIRLEMLGIVDDGAM
jgi:hypothetical protein